MRRTGPGFSEYKKSVPNMVCQSANTRRSSSLVPAPLSALHPPPHPQSTNILVENLLFNNPPFWATKFHDVRHLEIRWVGVNARRTTAHGHSLIDLSAFNTDGFDVSGQHIWIHDCEIVSQDDCITVKPSTFGSAHMLFERINATGFGLVIGSIGPSTVRNITFRDCNLLNTVKVRGEGGRTSLMHRSAWRSGCVSRLTCYLLLTFGPYAHAALAGHLHEVSGSEVDG